jgi:hypothetical protein
MSPDQPNARLTDQRSVIIRYPAGVSTARGYGSGGSYGRSPAGAWPTTMSLMLRVPELGLPSPSSEAAIHINIHAVLVGAFPDVRFGMLFLAPGSPAVKTAAHRPEGRLVVVQHAVRLHAARVGRLVVLVTHGVHSISRGSPQQRYRSARQWSPPLTHTHPQRAPQDTAGDHRSLVVTDCYHKTPRFILQNEEILTDMP